MLKPKTAIIGGNPADRENFISKEFIIVLKIDIVSRETVKTSANQYNVF